MMARENLAADHDKNRSVCITRFDCHDTFNGIRS